jgi:transcriptional regulator with XRE-family HTH domain
MTPTTSPIRAARQRAGLSGELLAQRAGISVAWLRTIERAPGLASPDVLRRLAAALELEPLAFVRARGVPEIW